MGPLSIKTLGILWNQNTDEFMFKTETILRIAESYGPVPTKRQISSLTSKIFDPLGIVSPIVLPGKLIMQSAWDEKLNWDEKLKPEMTQQWKVYLEGIRKIDAIRVPRWIEIDANKPFDIHVFCDASEDAYGAVLFSRQIDVTGRIKTQLIAAKTRVSQKPKKTVTMPRLELLSNVLAANLTKYVVKAYKDLKIQTHCWTDSMIALHSIWGNPEKWKTFIHNRVVQIREAFDPLEVRHCPGLENPADLAYRGASSTLLWSSKNWWVGPDWFRKNDYHWPKQPERCSEEELLEVNKEALTFSLIAIAPAEDSFLGKYSSFIALYQSTAVLLRW